MYSLRQFVKRAAVFTNYWYGDIYSLLATLLELVVAAAAACVVGLAVVGTGSGRR